MRLLPTSLFVLLALFYGAVTPASVSSRENLTETISSLQKRQDMFGEVIEKTGKILTGFGQDDSDAGTSEDGNDSVYDEDEVSFISTPGLILPQITQTLSLNCSWSIDLNRKKDPELFSISSIAIKHDRKTIVTYGKDLPVSIIEKDKNLIADGKYSNKFGYLEVTYKAPTDNRSGRYACILGGTDKDGSPKVIDQIVDVNDVNYVMLVNEIDSLKRENENLNKNILKTNSQLESLKAHIETKIFFSVGLSYYGWFEIGKPVKYDVVLSNVGAGYDKTNGIFTAPVKGYYRFDLHLTSDGSDAQVGIRVNGKFVVEAISYGSDSYDTVSNGCIVHLNKGDAVDVTGHERRSFLTTRQNSMNTFSGELISLD